MANRFQREPIIAGDYGVWGTPELTQDRAGAIGQLTAQLYNDAGALKVSKGVIGFDNDSNKGVIIIDTITTISLVGLTASRWAIVEVYITGTTPTFTITSLAAENDPGAIPTTEFTDVYDPEKGGFYYVSNERLLGLAWINSGGSLEGIVNCLPYINGYQGYSITDDANDFYYRWEKNINDTGNNYYNNRKTIIEVTKDDAQSINSGSTDIIQYDDVITDFTGEYDNTVNYRFTAIYTGTYHITASIMFTSYAWVATNVAFIRIYKGGVGVRYLERKTIEANVSMYLQLKGSTDLFLLAGEYIDIRVNHNRGVASALIADNNYNYFTVHKI